MLTEAVRTSLAVALGASLVPYVGCTPGDSSSRGAAQPVVEASGPAEGTSEVPVEALASLQTVYVPLSGTSLLSLDGALDEKGYGNVKSSDFRPQFEYAETEIGRAVVAYSSSDWIPGESLFQPMSLTQWLEAALAVDEASGVVINPGHPGQSLALSRVQVTEAMQWLPQQSPLPMEIYIAQ